ncbi:DMT family transporter [Chelatococcus sp. SYSU_G07232]|uniref:DMT family transporter n=1 Tax=Chelatococcus albus TaxID=3047466 RepID=A0ABT7AIH9_9HYPH|nr:DMT family transporter [Chelatococcus sp. SYSU_G07232]MDJ1159173.1 DMT family transporter [Chelatococcus sp. SYSU_G07232]
MTFTQIRRAVLEPRHATLAGIGMMVTGIFLFSVNDVMGKWLVATYPVAQVLLVRSLAALIMLAPFIRREGVAAFRGAPRPGLQILRVVFSTLEVACFYWAVTSLPLADVMTYYLAGPIYVTALSALFLGEKVGWRRWAAVTAGFAGVLVALQPSPATLTLPALVSLAGSLFFALLMITTRKLSGTSDTVLVTGQTVAALLLGLVMAPFAWVAPGGRDLALLSLLGIVAMVAHVCVNRALKLAPASVVVPYQYMLIVWAVVFGYLVFGDVPQASTLVGAAIIVGAGLFIFLREQSLARPQG